MRFRWPEVSLSSVRQSHPSTSYASRIPELRPLFLHLPYGALRAVWALSPGEGAVLVPRRPASSSMSARISVRTPRPRTRAVGLGRARSRCRLRPRVQEGRDVHVPLHDPSHADARQDPCDMSSGKRGRGRVCQTEPNPRPTAAVHPPAPPRLKWTGDRIARDPTASSRSLSDDGRERLLRHLWPESGCGTLIVVGCGRWIVGTGVAGKLSACFTGVFVIVDSPPCVLTCNLEALDKDRVQPEGVGLDKLQLRKRELLAEHPRQAVSTFERVGRLRTIRA